MPLAIAIVNPSMHETTLQSFVLSDAKTNAVDNFSLISQGSRDKDRWGVVLSGDKNLPPQAVRQNLVSATSAKTVVIGHHGAALRMH